jgi:hypothetical protein
VQGQLATELMPAPNYAAHENPLGGALTPHSCARGIDHRRPSLIDRLARLI